MFLLLLEFAHQANQVAPNVYVTVQQPSAGMPEWIKIVISVGVGAVGILGNLAMEFIRPRIAKADLKRAIAIQIVHELKTNLARISETLSSLSQTAENHILCNVALEGVAKLQWDRYNFYLEAERASIYEMDPFDVLGGFVKIDEEICGLARRYKFDDVRLIIDQYTKRSSKVVASLSKNPTRPIPNLTESALGGITANQERNLPVPETNGLDR